MSSSRRRFLQVSGSTLGAMALGMSRDLLSHSKRVSIIADPSDAAVASDSCHWALEELSDAIQQSGITVGQFTSVREAPRQSFCIVACDARHEPAAAALRKAGEHLPKVAESLALVPYAENGRRGTVACGDPRGLMYALLELADRVRHSEQPLAALEQHETVVERPFNAIRSVGRIFCSEIQDKPWFYDREMWPAYFSMLATQRFNRFTLNLGIGYDFLDSVRDSYFLFAYPFLLSVPGYDVRAVNLPNEERDSNFEMLQFISSQAVAHGLEFQLGIWTHGYHWGSKSQPNYTIEGLTSDNHAAYSRDALTALLKACPDISGVTLRTHGESGVREGSYSFWSTLFSALPASGRKVRLDLHTKGMDQKLVDAALQTGMPVTLSPKYWAEHMGLPYHQAAIRELEMPHGDGKAQDFFALSSGSRSFTRYGYADFLREDRQYGIMFRIWPGSHRLLLWGDPSSEAAHSRAFNFCGCNGAELFEPLSFKGRRGSGIAGSRCAYADKSLEPHWDWEKYLYTYRSWGRLMYNPDSSPDVCQRYLRKQFGAAAESLNSAFGSATPITEIITTAHLPSAANEGFSPEYYTNQSIVDASKPSPYFDTPAPKVFGNVSPLDPQLFSTINEYVAEILNDKRSGKYSPVELAEWLDNAAQLAASHVAAAQVTGNNSPEFRRAVIDLKIEIGIGHFFAAKLRSGVLYSAYQQSGDRASLAEAVTRYRRARDIWRDFAEAAKQAYLSDITFGPSPHQRGNWLDRLPAIDDDLADMQKQLNAVSAAEAHKHISVKHLMSPALRDSVKLRHNPPRSFVPGQSLYITIAAQVNPSKPEIRLCYRHVNQAEKYERTTMNASGNRFSASIPGDYTNSSYPLQYYFEVSTKDNAWLFPGLGENLRQQPYFVVRRHAVDPANGHALAV